VDGMLKMLQRLIGENIDLIWIPGTRLWPVKVDPSQIDQILANLCVNARDAVNGIGKITIETTNAAFDAEYCHKHLDYAPGNYVMLAVSDNGCGMDKETQNKIFEPFYTSKELGQGTGLGLSTVYGIVKQNNGFIYIYSEPNQGTTFKIYLPVHAAKAESLQTEELLQTEEPPQTALLSHETILLVEDETAILSMTSKMLRREGYTVLIASTPSEAIQIAARQNHEIHLLMTDVIMPNMNCLDLVRNISSFYPNIKCLFMSGYTANVITHHGILNDGVNFIQKPFSKKSMVTKVRQILDQKAFNKFLFT
jgi:CheY-like chemotaxis protein